MRVDGADIWLKSSKLREHRQKMHVYPSELCSSV